MMNNKIFKILGTVLLAASLFIGGFTCSIKADSLNTDYVTVSVYNANSAAGKVSIAVKDGDSYIDSGKTSIQVAKGTKVKIWFENGLNEGYEMVGWYLDNGASLQLISENGQTYGDTKFIKTVNEDFAMCVLAKSADDVIISYYDTSVKDFRSLIGVEAVKKNGSAVSENVHVPKKQGFNFTGWSLELNEVNSDVETYPVYESGIWPVLRDYYPQFFSGLLTTLALSVISVSMALIAGVLLCLIRMGDNKFFSFIVSGYVEIIRGVPLLLQLLLLYIIIGPTKISFGGFFTTEVISCILALFINSSAYCSEIFRSGIQAVDKGQMEAGRALGLGKWQVYRKIVIPQGVRNALPSIVNELVAMIKETSLAVSIDASIGELMCVRKSITAATYINLPPYIIVAMIYFCVTFSLSKVVGLIEKRLAQRD